MRKKKRRCSNDVSIPSQYPWCRAEKKKRRCSNDVSVPSQYMWWRAEKEDNKMQQWHVNSTAVSMEKSWKRRKEGAAQPVPSMLNVSQSYQRTYRHTVGLQYLWEGSYHPPKTQDELLGLIVDNDNSADETIIITFEDDIIITDNDIKR